MSTTNDTTHYHCSCPAGLDGDDCDQETYCSDSSNAKSIGQLCGFSEATCEMNNGRYSCANCAPNYEVDVRSGRCVLRLDLCQNANCARDREVCRYQNDGTNVNVMCDCAPGYVRSESDSGESCVPACSLKTCDKTEGECVWDALNGKAQCTCRPGYAFENEKCVLNENAVYVSGRLRLKVQPEQMDNQRRLVKLMRSHPDLNCTKTIDVGSCIRAAANLNSQLLGPDPPHQSGYLLLEFERTLEEMLQKFDEEWAVAAGQPVPSIKSQARVISLRPVHPMKSIDVATTLGLFAEYEAKLALVVVGAELGERERQWRQACIRQPLPAHLIVSTDNFELDGEEKEQESVQLTQAKNEQQCVIMNRLSWLPRLTRVGWLDMCRLNMHSCDRHTTCRGRRGQYRCECNAGFRRDKEVIRNSFVQDMCLDIDECAESLHQCQKWTVCENTLGSYRCNCFENFRRLTDYQCVGKSKRFFFFFNFFIIL